MPTSRTKRAAAPALAARELLLLVLVAAVAVPFRPVPVAESFAPTPRRRRRRGGGLSWAPPLPVSHPMRRAPSSSPYPSTSLAFRGAVFGSGASGLLFSSPSSSLPPSSENDGGFWERLAESLSRKVGTTEEERDDGGGSGSNKAASAVQLATLLRVGVPSLLCAVSAALLFPVVALTLASLVNDAGVFAVLSQDSSQFVQNFLTVGSLLFSILVGQTYYFMYQQQEAVYYALFDEVTEAKSLLEQVALVCQGRAMYSQVLRSIAAYVRDDLKRLEADPAVLLSARPVDDPLESIMYMTSVGVPSTVYETVRSLRQARAARLGALQRKLPRVHMQLLWVLAAIELVSFPLLGAGTQTLGGYNILTVEGCLFGVMTFGIVMTLRVVTELWRPAGGAYNVDAVLSVMVRGLEEELRERMSGKRRASGRAPTPQFELGGPDDGAVRVAARLSDAKAQRGPSGRSGR